MKVLLIGANGQLGTDLQKVLPGDDLVPLTHREIEVKDRESVLACLRAHRPDVVLNTSAFHQVDICEKQAEEAFAVNSVAVGHLADACVEAKAALVHLSTDYVFGADAHRQSPYHEEDREAPINVYGVSKLAGEKILQSRLRRHFIVRTSGLFGVAGSSGKGGNFVELMIRLGREKGKVKVVHDQALSPTYTLNLAENIRALMVTDHYGLYHCTSQGECSWYEFACTIFEQLGMRVECTPCTSEEFPTRARRPAYSALDNRKLEETGLNRMNSWEENLRRYLIEKGHLSA